MDAALLLLALLGHAALWVGLVNRLHARRMPRWLLALLTVACFLALPLVPAGLGWWCYRADPAVLDRLRAGEFLRSAPLGVSGLPGILRLPRRAHPSPAGFGCTCCIGRRP